MTLTEHAYIFYYGIPIVILLILATITIKNNVRARENQLLTGSFILFAIIFIAEWYRHLAPLYVSPFISVWLTGMLTVLSLSMIMHTSVKLFEKYTHKTFPLPVVWLYSFLIAQALVAFTPLAPSVEQFTRNGIWIHRDAPLYFTWILIFVFASFVFDFIIFQRAYKYAKERHVSRHLFTFLMNMIVMIVLLYVGCLFLVPKAYMPSLSTIYMMVFLAIFIMIGMQRYNLFPQYSRRYATMFERSPICKFMLDERFKIQEANEQTIKYFGEGFIESNFPKIMKNTGNMPQVQTLVQMLDEFGEVSDAAFEFTHIRTGERTHLVINAIKIEEGGEIFYYVMFRDQTVEVLQKERIRELAFYDSLTKLPNRTAFMNEAAQYFEKHDDSGIILFDLNYFKRVNDEHGHAAGDEVLRATGRVLLRYVCPPHMPARLGGDEFVIYLNEAVLDVSPLQFVSQLREALEEEPVFWNDERLYISPSMGYCSKNDCSTFDLALQEADKNMYKDKSRIKQLSTMNK